MDWIPAIHSSGVDGGNDEIVGFNDFFNNVLIEFQSRPIVTESGQRCLNPAYRELSP